MHALPLFTTFMPVNHNMIIEAVMGQGKMYMRVNQRGGRRRTYNGSIHFAPGHELPDSFFFITLALAPFRAILFSSFHRLQGLSHSALAIGRSAAFLSPVL